MDRISPASSTPSWALLRRTRALVGVVVASVLIVVPALVSAHETGQGQDLGRAYLRVDQTDGAAMVSVRMLDSALCAQLEPRGLTGQRAETIVTGSLQAAGECAFAGHIELPESGRWLLLVALEFDGRPAETSIPVGITPGTHTFENEQWVHVDSVVAQTGFQLDRRLLIYGLLGLLAGGLLADAARRWLKSRRMGAT